MPQSASIVRDPIDAFLPPGLMRSSFEVIRRARIVVGHMKKEWDRLTAGNVHIRVSRMNGRYIPEDESTDMEPEDIVFEDLPTFRVLSRPAGFKKALWFGAGRERMISEEDLKDDPDGDLFFSLSLLCCAADRSIPPWIEHMIAKKWLVLTFHMEFLVGLDTYEIDIENWNTSKSSNEFEIVPARV